MKPLVGLIVIQSVLDALKLPEKKILLNFFCVLAGCMQRQCLVLSLLLCFIICSATNNNSSSLKS